MSTLEPEGEIGSVIKELEEVLADCRASAGMPPVEPRVAAEPASAGRQHSLQRSQKSFDTILHELGVYTLHLHLQMSH